MCARCFRPETRAPASSRLTIGASCWLLEPPERGGSSASLAHLAPAFSRKPIVSEQELVRGYRRSLRTPGGKQMSRLLSQKKTPREIRTPSFPKEKIPSLFFFYGQSLVSIDASRPSMNSLALLARYSNDCHRRSDCPRLPPTSLFLVFTNLQPRMSSITDITRDVHGHNQRKSWDNMLIRCV